MSTLPEFVTDGKEENDTTQERSPPSLTGWETVRFQLDDDPDSELSTAAIAP